MASEVQLDALPYVDQGYDEPGVREAVSLKPSFLDHSCRIHYLITGDVISVEKA